MTLKNAQLIGYQVNFTKYTLSCTFDFGTTSITKVILSNNKAKVNQKKAITKIQNQINMNLNGYWAIDIGTQKLLFQLILKHYNLHLHPSGLYPREK